MGFDGTLVGWRADLDVITLQRFMHDEIILLLFSIEYKLIEKKGVNYGQQWGPTHVKLDGRINTSFVFLCLRDTVYGADRWNRESIWKVFFWSVLCTPSSPLFNVKRQEEAPSMSPSYGRIFGLVGFPCWHITTVSCLAYIFRRKCDKKNEMDFFIVLATFKFVWRVDRQKERITKIKIVFMLQCNYKA